MDSERDSVPGNFSKGRLLSNRFDSAPRELSTIARWLDVWVADPKQAIGAIFDLGDSHSQAAEYIAIYELIFSNEPVIDVHDFNKACLEWLNSGPHDSYQYETLFRVLQKGRDEFYLPEVFEWYLNNFDNLKKAFSYPESGYSRFMEMMELLSTGKTLKDYDKWWRDQVREARRHRGEI